MEGRNEDPHQVEERLLTHVIEDPATVPGDTSHRGAVADSPDWNRFLRPFIEQGFDRHARLFMVLPLNEPAQKTAMVSPEIEIRRWSEQDYQAAASIITAAYKGHVDSLINDQYRSLSGSLRFLNNIVRFPRLRDF